MLFEQIPQELFFTKHDAEDPRLGDFASRAELSNLQSGSVVIWGAPDDEGIRLNGGRAGAATAPNEIRRAFYKMTPPARGAFRAEIQDLGNLSTQGSLAEKHERARTLSIDLHKRGLFAVSFGGGHDYGFPDASGFVENYREQNPLVVNFDAHLDVRPSKNGFHSGTPFRRLIENYPQAFEFFELGLQPQCNSRFHADWAESQGAHLVFLDEMMNLTPEVVFKNPDAKRPCFLSVDIDAFSSKEAPGCSQSWATGLTIETFLPWLRFLMKSFQVKGIGFYEVSPALDVDSRTSKLAALILFHALCLRSQKGFA